MPTRNDCQPVHGFREYAMTLLENLEAAIPPPKHCHHVISFGKYGSDATGWEDKLIVQVNRNGLFQQVFIEEQDCYKTANEVVDEIVQALKDGDCMHPQEGVGVGQFIKDNV